MDYITVKEAGVKWGVSARDVAYHITFGRIPGAIKKGNLWLIPASAPHPEDRRYKNNKQQPNKNNAQKENEDEQI